MSLSDRKGVRVSCGQHTAKGRGKSSALMAASGHIPGKSSVNRVSLQEVSRQRFADMIRECFPGKHDAETARLAADVLGYHADTVRNWLECKSEPPFGAFFAIQARFGFGRALDTLTRGEGQRTIWDRITGRGNE